MVDVEDGIRVAPSNSPAEPDCLVPVDPLQGRSPFVLDISSDEEGSGLLMDDPKFSGSDDYDWLADIFRNEAVAVAATSGGVDDSDEVVVVKEVNAKSKTKGSRAVVVAADDDDDDDCIILDCDPDKTEAASDGSAGGGSSDDLVVVGEKGQIACRDYPHSRHLCISFPFSGTSHENHCKLCHCYVCDLPAPCILWGTGAISTDHCHATDKEEFWRVRRKQSKEVKTSMAPSVKLPNGSIPAVPQFTPAPLLAGAAHIIAHTVPNNFVRTLNPFSAASTTSNFSTVNVSATNTPTLHARLGSQQMIRVNGAMRQRFRAPRNGSQLTPHPVSSMPAFKRCGSVRTPFSVNDSSQVTASHAWSLLYDVNPVNVQKNPTSRHNVLPGAIPTPYTNLTSFPPQLINLSSNIGPPLNSVNTHTPPPTYPAIADTTRGWSNCLSQSVQQLPPAYALDGNDGQPRTCQLETVNEPKIQSAGICGLTVAEIKNWLLEDTAPESLEGTLSFDFGNILE